MPILTARHTHLRDRGDTSTDQTLVDPTVTGGQETVNALTSSTTIDIDMDLGPIHEVTLAHNTTWSISNAANGKSATVRVLQDGTGGRTQAFPAGWKLVGSFTAGTTADKVDVLEIYQIDGVVYYQGSTEA